MCSVRIASERACIYWVSEDHSRGISSLIHQLEEMIVNERYLNYRSSLFSRKTLEGCVLNYVSIFHIFLYTFEINDIRANICSKRGPKMAGEEINRS